FTETCEQDPQVRHGREHARERGDEREPRELRAYGELEDVELRDESDRRRQPREREQQRPERYHEERTPPREATQVGDPRAWRQARDERERSDGHQRERGKKERRRGARREAGGERDRRVARLRDRRIREDAPRAGLAERDEARDDHADGGDDRDA